MSYLFIVSKIISAGLVSVLSFLCGIQHAFMPISVKVVSEEDYAKWLLEAKQKFAKEEKKSNIELAKKIIQEQIK